MSSALGIAGVTAVLEGLLQSILNNANLGHVTTSARAPDVVQASLGTASSAALQVNLFLHQVTLNGAWRNVELPALAADGATRLANPLLALDLHYLLTAYASEDYEAEALLGYGVQFIHENPILPRSQIRSILGALAQPPSGANTWPGMLAASGIADQIEMIKLAPATLGREELAWLWTALKADYRPTFPFQASTVLVQSQAPLLSSLPVLQRQISAVPGLTPTLPTLTAVNPPGGQPAGSLGDVVTVQGINLSTAASVVLSNARLGITRTLTPLTNVQSGSFQFTLPNPAAPTPPAAPTDLPAGVYLLAAQVPQGSDVVLSNSLPLAIAPKIGTAWAPGTLASGAAVSVTIPCAPYLRVGQQASLLIGSQAAPANPFTTPTNSPSFTFATLQPTGHSVPVRLRVDCIDSPIIDMNKAPPAFAGPSVQVT
jgi:Pvc16 N-terminal domain